MKAKIPFFLVFILLIILYSCNNSENIVSKSQTEKPQIKNLLTDFIPLYNDGDINVAIEIPAGTMEKWEVDKSDGQTKVEFIDGKKRIIQYLGYPANYGMIPRTYLSKKLGGDGDPLDVLVLGFPIKRSSVVKCKIIGVLYLLDRGEQDDKLIAVMEDTPLYDVNSIQELQEKYNGITDIIKLWFENYKGPGKMKSKGYGEKEIALKILNSAIKEYKGTNSK